MENAHAVSHGMWAGGGGGGDVTVIRQVPQPGQAASICLRICGALVYSVSDVKGFRVPSILYRNVSSSTSTASVLSYFTRLQI